MCTIVARDYRVTSSLTNISLCHNFVYKRLDQLTDKMSDSDESFDIFKDIKPYNFEPLVKKLTDSINCEELVATSADMHLEQPPMLPTLGPQHELDWCVFVCFGTLIDKSTHWA